MGGETGGCRGQLLEARAACVRVAGRGPSAVPGGRCGPGAAAGERDRAAPRLASSRSFGTTLSRSCPPQVFLLTSVSFRAGLLFENLGRAALPAAGGSLCSSGVLLSGISRGTNELLCPRLVTAIPRGKFCSQRTCLHPELPGEDLFTCTKEFGAGRREAGWPCVQKGAGKL